MLRAPRPRLGIAWCASAPAGRRLSAGQTNATRDLVRLHSSCGAACDPKRAEILRPARIAAPCKQHLASIAVLIFIWLLSASPSCHLLPLATRERKVFSSELRQRLRRRIVSNLAITSILAITSNLAVTSSSHHHHRQVARPWHCQRVRDPRHVLIAAATTTASATSHVFSYSSFRSRGRQRTVGHMAVRPAGQPQLPRSG